MRWSLVRHTILFAVAMLGVAGGARLAGAEDVIPPPKPQPTRALTEEEKAFLKKLLLHVDAVPDSGPAPLTVQLSVEIYQVESPVNPKYEWDFGDGSAKVRQQNPKHTYKKPGEYTAVIKVTDDAGQAGQDEVLITVEPPASK